MSVETGSSAPSSWDLTRIVLAVVALGGLIAASFWVLRPFLLATVWATMIVVATWPALRALQSRLWGKRGLAVAVMTVTMLLIVVAPIAVGVVPVVEHGEVIVGWSRSLAELSVPEPPAWVGGLPLVGDKIAGEWRRIASARPEDLAAHITPYLMGVVLWVIGEVGGIGAFLIQLLLAVAVSAILYSRGEVAAAGALAFARRLAGGAGEQVAVLSAQAIRAVALGIVVTALVQSIIGGIGLGVTGVPYPVLLTVVMFVLGVSQIGPAPVLLGAVIWLYWKDDTLWGTVMVGWGLVTGSLDNFLRPLLIRRGADLPLLLIFAGVIGGLLAFGIIGLFIGPVVLAVTYTLLQAWVAEGAPVPGRRAPATETAGRAALDR
jgi:predicted PurR-regulated permease PerM